MTTPTKEIIDALSDLARSKKLQVSVRQNLQLGVISLASGLIGALVLGPRGGIAGFLAGGIGAYNLTPDTYLSVYQVIHINMTDEERRLLCNHIRAAYRRFNDRGEKNTVELLTANEEFKEIAMHTLRRFFESEMKMKIVES